MIEDLKPKKYIKQSSILLFVLALTQQSYCTSTSCSYSFLVFLLGWAALFSTGAGLCWLANPLLFVSWMLLNKNLKASLFLAMASFLFSMFFLMFDSIVDNENNGHQVITAYKAGYWLWVASNACMFFGTCVLMYRHNVRYKTITRPRHF